MNFIRKIEILEKVLNETTINYADSFKSDIIIYFDEDFTVKNSKLFFLNNLESMEEIENFINNITSNFVMKFDIESETENDFIHYSIDHFIKNH
jgi:hypothetical protein